MDLPHPSYLVRQHTRAERETHFVRMHCDVDSVYKSCLGIVLCTRTHVRLRVRRRACLCIRTPCSSLPRTVPSLLLLPRARQIAAVLIADDGERVCECRDRER